MSVGFKHELFTQFARIGKCLSNANRLELLELLAQGELSVEALANKTELTIANTSQHLQQLRQVGMVSARKEGLHVYYSLAGDDVVALLSALRQVAESHLAEVSRLVSTYLTIKDSLEAVSFEELMERVRNGLVTVVDVRPQEEYAAGHVPGAINIPLDELESQLNSLPQEQEVIAYCRGPHCILAYEAVARLREQGINAHRLEDGFPEWKMSGLPIEKGSQDSNE